MHLHYVQLLTTLCYILQQYFNLHNTFRKSILHRLGQLLKNYRRKLQEVYILPDKETPTTPNPMNKVPKKYTTIIEDLHWADFVTHTNSNAYMV